MWASYGHKCTTAELQGAVQISSHSLRHHPEGNSSLQMSDVHAASGDCLAYIGLAKTTAAVWNGQP